MRAYESDLDRMMKCFRSDRGRGVLFQRVLLQCAEKAFFYSSTIFLSTISVLLRHFFRAESYEMAMYSDMFESVRNQNLMLDAIS